MWEIRDTTARSGLPASGVARTLWRYFIGDMVVVGPLVGPVAASVAASWEPLPNARAGVEELRWYEENKANLGNYRGLWIAISARGIVASGLRFDQVYETVAGQNLFDALIIRVPDDVNRRDYFIA